MLRSFLHCLCLVAILSRNVVKSTITEDEEPRRTFPARRAIDGSRGSQYYVDDGSFDSFGSSAGQYDPLEIETDFSDIRRNIPGEPGVDYPSYTRLPQTGFVCEDDFRGYYADEGAGCQVFHVCDGNFLVSSFLCPVGSIFSQKLLTCDWWIKVDCSTTRNYHAINSQSLVSDADDDDILRKAFEMASVRSAGERIPVGTVRERRVQDDRRQGVLDYGIGASTQRGINELQTGPDNYPDYPEYPSRPVSPKYRTSGQQLPNRQRYQENDYYSPEAEDDAPKRNDNPNIRVHTIGDDRKNDRRDPLRNEFQASYAPTVPTVTTTARRFYSPTIPTTPRTSTRSRDSSGLDLEVESSDHLYTARGRSDETVQAATAPSVVVGSVSRTENLSLPELVNSATEGNERIEESESSNRKTVTLPDFSTDLTKITSSTEETIKESRASEDITEALSIFTIDNENRDPRVFSYSRDEEEIKSNIESSSSPETRLSSTEASNSVSVSGGVKLAKNLEPPQKQGSIFRITVLEESSSTTPKIVEDSHSDEKSVKKNSTSSGSILVDVPASHVTPPWSANESQESRIIRIVINNNETRGRISSDSIVTQNPTVEKIEETATVGETSGTSAAVPTYDATPNTIPKFGAQRPVDVKNFGVSTANEESNFNVETRSAVEPSSLLPNIGDQRPVNLKNFGVSVANEESTFNVKSHSAVETSSLLDNIGDQRPVNLKNFGVSIANEESTFNVPTRSAVETSSLLPNIGDQRPINSTFNVTTLASIESSSIPSEHHQVGDAESSRHGEETLAKEEIIGDSSDAASSPFQVTLTVDRSDELDPNGDVIRRLIAQQENGHATGAGVYKNFEIVRSEERGEPLVQIPQERVVFSNDATSPRNDDRVGNEREGRKIGEEKLHNYGANNLQPKDYYRNIVDLINGPNAPRPFSFGSQQKFANVGIKTLSHPIVGEASTNSPLVTFGTSRNEIFTVTTRIPSQTTRQSIVSHEQPERLEKSFSTTDVGQDEGISEQYRQNFGDQKTGKQKFIFELPHPQRSLDFETGSSLHDSKKATISDDEDVDYSAVSEQSTEKLYSRTVVETEVIPSLGFSLNTDEGREEFMEAVMKGLLHYVPETENAKNETETSTES